MGTDKFVEDCPIDGCDYRTDRIAGRVACMEFVLKHVTETHKMSDKVLENDYCINCPMTTSCHEKFTGRQWVKVAMDFHEHLKNDHSTWIDPELCKTCADRRMEATMAELHPERNPKSSSAKIPEEKTVTEAPACMGMNVHDMTDEQYREYILYFNDHLPPGPEGEKLLKERKVVAGVDYRDYSRYS